MDSRRTQATLLVGGHGVAFLQAMNLAIEHLDKTYINQTLFWISVLSAAGASFAFREVGETESKANALFFGIPASLLCLGAIILNVIAMIAIPAGYLTPLANVLDQIPCLNCN